MAEGDPPPVLCIPERYWPMESMGTKGARRTILSILHPNTHLNPDPDPTTNPKPSPRSTPEFRFTTQCPSDPPTNQPTTPP